MMMFKAASCSAMVIAAMALGPACAQGAPGMVAPKKVFENDKLIMFDNVVKPGEESASANRGGLIYYYVQGGTIERTFADGTKETVRRKTGEAFLNPEKRPYAVKNTGKNTVHVISIQLK